MIITFVHGQKAFLPEVTAYTAFFGSLGYKCQTAKPEKVDHIETDVEWHFMGIDKRAPREGRIRIHEYLSGSVGRSGSMKDLVKKFVNAKPDFRLFLNAYVRNRFSFNDRIPFGYRDMGIDAEWLVPANKPAGAPRYDFVYLGDVSAARQPERLLDLFTKAPLLNRTLLVISDHYAHLQSRYSTFTNIRFTGPFPHSVIRSMLQEARYGINYIVDKPPFNRQTSTKFLEYAACGLPIVTTQSKWIEEFKSGCGGNYYYLNHDLSNFSWEQIETFAYASPDLSEWTWEKQIRRSGVLDFLEGKPGS